MNDLIVLTADLPGDERAGVGERVGIDERDSDAEVLETPGSIDHGPVRTTRSFGNGGSFGYLRRELYTWPEVDS